MLYLIKEFIYNILYFLIALNFLFSNYSENITDPIVILISFDGYRYDYSSLVHTPNFDYIEDNGVKAISLQPVFPSFTFPNHYSIATGCYSENHGNLGNVFYDYSRKMEYSYKDTSIVRDGSWYGCEPIWVTAEKNDIISATYFWVGSEAEIQNYRPTIYKNYKNGVNPIDKINEVIRWLNYPIEKRPRLVTLYFNEPDHSGHVYGSTNDETLMQIELADSILGYLFKSIENLNIKNQINIIIVSDHGMVDVSEDRLINIDDYININYEVYGKGPYVEIRNIKNNEDFVFPYIPYVDVYKNEYFPDRYHFKTDNLGEYLLLAEPGWLLYTNKDISEGGLTIKGMHGYDPLYIDMHGIFYAYGPQFKNGLTINTFESIHIYPIICKILNIKPNDTIDGKLKMLNYILK